MNNLIKSAAVFLLSAAAAQAQVIIADNYDVTPNGTGFDLNTGVNAGINPPSTTRLTGSAASGLRYIYTQGGTTIKPVSSYSIHSSGRLRTAGAANSGRFTLSDGTTPYNFGNALWTYGATAAGPSIYDVSITMANNLGGTQRFSFGLATQDGIVDNFDFGIQLYKGADGNYAVNKLVDAASNGGAADFKAPITISGVTLPAFGQNVNFRMRFTDAGGETGSDYNSQVQLFIDGVQVYDTSIDADLAGKFRFDNDNRVFVWDQAAGGSTGATFYDNFSVTSVPEPSVAAFGLLGGLALLVLRRKV